jgi:hypothetical protein
MMIFTSPFALSAKTVSGPITISADAEVALTVPFKSGVLDAPEGAGTKIAV